MNTLKKILLKPTKSFIIKWKIEKNAEERIRQMKEQAIKDIKNASVEIAISS